MRLMILSHNEKLGIDKSLENWNDYYNKHKEESEEVLVAIAGGNKEEIAEEVLDQIQVCINMLDKLSSEGINVTEAFRRHNKKLVNRYWKAKGVITIQCNMNV